MMKRRPQVNKLRANYNLTNHQRVAQNQSKMQNQIKTAKPTKTTGPKKRSKIPKEFKRLENWEQLTHDSTGEEDESQRQKAAVKAAVV